MQTRQMPVGDRIVPMAESDLPLVHQLECFSQQEPWSLQHFSDELNNPVASVDLYLCGDKLAGFLCAWLIAGEMQIQNIAVLPELRRRGIAARLLEHAIECGKEQGLDSICLEVRVSNHGAITLYERFGFLSSGTRPAYYPDGEDALLMTKSF